MNCNTPGFPVLHYLPEFAQTHIHCISDAIQPSHPLSPLLLLHLIFPSIRVFSNDLALCIRCAEYWNVSISPSNEYSQHVQHHEGQAEAHVGGDGEEDRKEGRLNESVPGPQAVPEGLQEQLARAAEDVELGAVVAVHGEAVAARLLRS